MNDYQNLQQKIQLNEEKLLTLKKKRENLDFEIQNLENKLKNQKRALPHLIEKSAMEKAFPTKD